MEGALKLVPALAAVVLLAGCRHAPQVPYPTYASAPTPYVPSGGSGNAYDAYVLAAGEAEAALAPIRNDPLHRTFFTPRQRDDLLKALGPALQRVAGARGSCDFRYVPIRPGAPLSNRAAWRLLGRALRWRIDDRILENDPLGAVREGAVAFRFGNDLCGGGPGDRTLGVEIAEDARKALLPILPRLDVAGLRALANAGKAGLSRRPSLEQTLVHGDADMSLALQSFQDAYRANDYAPIQTALGKDFRDLKSTLDELRGKDGAKRAEFFANLDADRQRLSAAWHAAARLSRARRADVMDVRLRGDRARKAFARHFFLIGGPLLEIEDRSLARQRLLVLEAELRRVVKLSGRAPASLDAVKPPWAIDPYDGRTFGYLPDGAEFRVYSVGENLRDDLGDTDEAGLTPDLRTVIP